MFESFEHRFRARVAVRDHGPVMRFRDHVSREQRCDVTGDHRCPGIGVHRCRGALSCESPLEHLHGQVTTFGFLDPVGHAPAGVDI